MPRFRRIASEEARAIVTAITGDDSDSDGFILTDSDSDYDPMSDHDNREEDIEPDETQPEHDDDEVMPDPSTIPSTSTSSATSRPRGRPKGSASSTQPTQTEQTEQHWRQVLGEGTDNNIRFIPKKTPGVCADLTATSSALECLLTLLTEDILEGLRTDINDYGRMKCMINNPPKKRSVYRTWTEISMAELYRYLSVLIVMGMNNRPRFRDFFSKKPHLRSEWFNDMFTRDRFEAIHYTMLHCSEVGAQGKAKIEPFVDSLLSKFQDAFYPFQEVSIDEMVIGWKGRFASKQYNPSKPSKYHVTTFGL